MARRPPITTCRQPGCPELVTGTAWCDTHQPKPWAGKGHGQRLGKSGSRRQADNWRTLQAHDHVCHWCGFGGADQVDHVIPLEEGGTDTDDNRRPIHSHPCHTAKTAAEARRGRQRQRLKGEG